MRKISRIVVLVGIVLFSLLIWKEVRKDDQKLGQAFRYAVEDISRIQTIQIMDRSGQIDHLEREGDHWRYNGTYRVRENAMDNLLRAVGTLELQYIPAPQALKNIVQGLSSTGLQVSIYDRNQNLLKRYYVGGATPDERGTYMIMDGADQPAVVSIPGFEGSLRPRYDMPAIDWRDRMLFRFSPESIVALTVDYPDHPDQSFRLRPEGLTNQASVTALYDQYSKQEQSIRPGAIEAYLDGFRAAGAEAILQDPQLVEQLEGGRPYVRFSIEDQSGTNTFHFYPIPVEKDASVRDRIERYYVVDNSEDVYLIQHLVFKELFLGLDFFYPPL